MAEYQYTMEFHYPRMLNADQESWLKDAIRRTVTELAFDAVVRSESILWVEGEQP